MADVVQFDPDALRIIEISTGGDNELTVLEVYSEWKAWLTADPTRLKYPAAFVVIGGDPISATANLGSTFFLANGWRIRPAELNHKLTLVGNLFVEGGVDDPVVNTLGAYNVRVVMRVSNLTDAVLLNSPDIQFGSFNNAVTIDVVNGTAGTEYPTGTPRQPCSSLTDAATIAVTRGFRRLDVLGDLTIGPLGVQIPEPADNDFEDAFWTAHDLTVQPAATTGPFGLTDASRLECNAAAYPLLHHLSCQPSGAIADRETTFSIYCKADDLNFVGISGGSGAAGLGAWFNLATGEITPDGPQGAGSSYDIISVGSGWWQCIIRYVHSGDLPEIHIDVRSAILAPPDETGLGIFVYGAAYSQHMFTGVTIQGESRLRSHIHIDDNADVQNCEFNRARVTGFLDGNNRLDLCEAEDLEYIDGVVTNSELTGTLTLTNLNESHLIDCHSGAAGPVTLDMSGGGGPVTATNFNGSMVVQNKTGASAMFLGLASGHVTLNSTVTAGTITVSGIGTVTDNSTGTTVVDTTGLVGPVTTVLDEALAGHVTAGTVGAALANLDVAVSSVDLTPTQATMLLEMYRLLGLDPTRPLVVSADARDAGAEISQTIVESAGTVTVTRQ